jgi:hypothetical protein
MSDGGGGGGSPSPLFAGGQKFDPNLTNQQDEMLGLGSGFLFGPNGGLLGQAGVHGPGTIDTNWTLGGVDASGTPPTTTPPPAPVDTTLHQGEGTDYTETQYGRGGAPITTTPPPTTSDGTSPSTTDLGNSLKSLMTFGNPDPGAVIAASSAPGNVGGSVFPKGAPNFSDLTATIANNKLGNQGAQDSNNSSSYLF